MKALVLLLASVCAFGQHAIDPSCVGHLPSSGECLAPSCPSGWYLTADQKKCNRIPAPKPLKCGKYEHLVPSRMCVSEATSQNLVDCDANGKCVANCTTQDSCAPIMHEVTEKDWQELMERLKNLEGAQLTIRNNVIFCPAGKHPSMAKGNISWDQMCVDDAKRAGKE